MKNLTACLVISCILLVSCTSGPPPLFISLTPEQSGINFENRISEDAMLSVLNYEYIYNGGGVATADLNNDGLNDIFFTGNMVSSRLYLNQGAMKFRDITKEAGVNTEGRWCKGVSIVDVNNDGWSDIYVCAAVVSDSNARKNLLFVNQGLNKESGLPTFREMASSYGLADASNTHMAAFFDYDRDGDLDAYLLVNDLDGTYPNEFRPIRKDGSWPNTDKLLQNQFDSIRGHAFFTDVSASAGILTEGYGLGLNITDINQDGWPDIYVSNDYISNNLLYINNRDGTFTDNYAKYFKISSRNAMGNDVGDINNDGLPDIIEADMAPANHYRLRMMYNDISYQTFQNSERFGYMHQYPRNTLQLNMGFVNDQKDSSSRPVFAEIAYLAGVAHTEWSWATLFADVDQDGYKDLLVSNGIPRDMTDLDFMNYRKFAVARTPVVDVLKQMPAVRVSNFIFRNRGDLTFADETKKWGWDMPSFSAGMAVADLDGDGDLDVVVNNTNMAATLLRNDLVEQKPDLSYLRIKLKGDEMNIDATGAVVKIFYGEEMQWYEYQPYRGYMSTIENIAHFGLGNTASVDSAIVIWPDGGKQLVTAPAINRTHVIEKKINAPAEGERTNTFTAWFTEITDGAGLKHPYREVDFIDFNIQRLIPHKLSQYGPSIAAGDLDGDGLDDVVIGGGSPLYATLYFQKASGRFEPRPLVKSDEIKYQDDAGISLFDADSDGDLDIYIASGGCENEPQSKAYVDHFYLNEGKGIFREMVLPILNNRATKSVVRAADFDGDGDIDLFVGGRVIPGRYPLPGSSFIYRNDSKNGEIIFTDVTGKLAPELFNIGMVTDALWTDLTNDNLPELVLATQWGPVKIFNNLGIGFEKLKGVHEEETGWWNSLVAADPDNDGDMDLVVGNFGMNSFLQPSVQYPISIYAKDFDNNSSFDAFVTSYYMDTIYGVMKEFPIAGRDDLIREMSVMKERFPDHRSYARSDISRMSSLFSFQDAVVLKANNFKTGWFENKGNFQFGFHAFPLAAQMAPVYGIQVFDMDGDGFLDIAMIGNEFSMAPGLGRQTAFNGLILKGDGKGGFAPLTLQESGFYVPGNGKALASLVINGRYALLAGQNMGYSRTFLQNDGRWERVIRFLPHDRYAEVFLSNGTIRREEIFDGGFLSSSAKYICINESVSKVVMNDLDGKKRTVYEKK